MICSLHYSDRFLLGPKRREREATSEVAEQTAVLGLNAFL